MEAIGEAQRTLPQGSGRSNARRLVRLPCWGAAGSAAFPVRHQWWASLGVRRRCCAVDSLSPAELSPAERENLRQSLALLEAAVESAPGELALAGFAEAADFAGLAEEISRRVE